MESKKPNYPIKWEVKSHSYQIADTGDYDGYWEITNGKDSLITKDDYEDIDKDLQELVDLLNNTYPNFTVDRGNEAALDAENKFLRQEIEELRNAHTGLMWVKVSNRLPENDMHLDYPREYCLMCKCDGSRGSVEYKQGNFSEIQDLWQNGPYDVIWWLDERSNANQSTPAGREEAIAFAEWLNSNYISIENKDGRPVYVEYGPQEYDRKQQYRIEFLYDIFKKENP